MKKHRPTIWTTTLFALIVPLTLSSAPSSSDRSEPIQELDSAIVEVDKHYSQPRNRSVRRVREALGGMPIDREALEQFGNAPREYLQFERLLTKPERRTLRRQGILLSGYARDNTYIAAINQRGRDFLLTAEGVTLKGAIPIEDKLEPGLQGGKIHPWAKDESGSVVLRVRFHDHVPLDVAIGVVEGLGGTVMDENGFPGFYGLLVSLAPDSIDDLARSNFVCNVGPKPGKVTVHNSDAAKVSGTDTLWQPPLNLNGAGYAVGSWDFGTIYPHPEFAGRLFYDDATPFNSHSTHVAGTIAAGGILGTPDSQDAHGMASQVNIVSYDSGGYFPEFAQAIVAGNIVISHNSWGYIIGWDWFPGCDQSDGCLPPIPAQWWDYGSDGAFGNYLTDSAQIDDMADFAEETGQTFLIVHPAGNNRDQPPFGPYEPHDGTYFLNPDEDLSWSFYDNIGPLGTAKNNITVGSVRQDKTMPSYSGWGPADDGRVKPDLVAKGDGLVSPDGASSYGVMVGTSMATAVVSGSAVLVIEHFENTFATTPTNGELKALLLNTAEDLGNPGPDYVYGFGLLQTQAAIELIDQNEDTSSITNGELDTGETDTYNLEVVPGTPSIKTTLAWMDEPANPAAGPPFLINQLDLKLISPTAQEFFPFSLNPAQPVDNATATGPNTVDTVEQVVVEDPEVGTWTVEVAAPAVPVGPQKYGLVSKIGLSAPTVFDYLPPAGIDSFPWPYRRPILSARYIDPSGNGIDPDSVLVKLDSFNITSLSVVGAEGAYFEPTFDLWLGEISFKVTVANNAGVASTGVMDFKIVEAGEVEDLTVELGPSNEAILEWGDSSYDNFVLYLNEFRIYRSTNLQTELEWIGTTAPAVHTFTDPSPPAGLVNYEVHAHFESGTDNGILSIRNTPYRTQQPILGSPRPGDTTPPGTFVVRFRGLAEPGAEVFVYADGGLLGSDIAGPDGVYVLNHDFGGPGVHTAYVQVKKPGESLSVPCIEAEFEVPAP